MEDDYLMWTGVIDSNRNVRVPPISDWGDKIREQDQEIQDLKEEKRLLQQRIDNM